MNTVLNDVLMLPGSFKFLDLHPDDWKITDFVAYKITTRYFSIGRFQEILTQLWKLVITSWNDYVNIFPIMSVKSDQASIMYYKSYIMRENITIYHNKNFIEMAKANT